MVKHTTPPKHTSEVIGTFAEANKESKVERDMHSVEAYARGFVLLDGSGGVVRSHLRPTGQLPVIAVVSPDGLLLEVGLNRTTPYKPFEFGAQRSLGVRGTNFTYRVRVRELHEHEFAIAYPVVVAMLEELMLLQRSTWKSKEEWWVPGLSKPVHKGIGIRVRKEDALMYRQVLLEDIRLRSRIMRKLASSVHFWLKGYKYAVGYSDKLLRSSSNAGRVADALSYQCDTPMHLVVAMRKMLGAFSGSKSWSLCEEIMRAYRLRPIDEDACETMREFLFPHKGHKLAPLEHVHIRIEDERSGKMRHGQGCVTCEVFPTNEFVIEREGYPERSLLTKGDDEAAQEREAIQGEGEIPSQTYSGDDDIPF